MTKAQVKRPKGKPKPPKDWKGKQWEAYLDILEDSIVGMMAHVGGQVEKVLGAVQSDYRVIQESMRQLSNQIDAIRVLHQHDLGAVDTMRRTALELLALTEKKARQGD